MVVGSELYVWGANCTIFCFSSIIAETIELKQPTWDQLCFLKNYSVSINRWWRKSDTRSVTVKQDLTSLSWRQAVIGPFLSVIVLLSVDLHGAVGFARPSNAHKQEGESSSTVYD